MPVFVDKSSNELEKKFPNSHKKGLSFGQIS